jgi:monoamine oxidase
MNDVESHLARIQSIDKGKRRKNVIVLGAGMAGLVAAYELKTLGHQVRIFV